MPSSKYAVAFFLWFLSLILHTDHVLVSSQKLVFHNVTDRLQLSIFNESVTFSGCDFELQTYIDPTNNNNSYNYIQGTLPQLHNGAILETNIYDTNFKQYNNINSNIDFPYIMYPYSTDQFSTCSSIINNNIITCYVNWYINQLNDVICSIYNVHKSTFKQIKKVSNTNSQSVQVLCLNDGYLILFLAFNGNNGFVVQYSLLDFDGNIIKRDVSLPQTNSKKEDINIQFMITNIANSTHLQQTTTFLMQFYPEGARENVYVYIGEYKGINSNVPVTLTTSEPIKVNSVAIGYDYYSPPIVLDFYNAFNKNCCYVISYIGTGYDAYIAFLDYNGNKVIEQDINVALTGGFGMIELTMFNSNVTIPQKYFLFYYYKANSNTILDEPQYLYGVVFSLNYNKQSNGFSVSLIEKDIYLQDSIGYVSLEKTYYEYGNKIHANVIGNQLSIFDVVTYVMLNGDQYWFGIAQTWNITD